MAPMGAEVQRGLSVEGVELTRVGCGGVSRRLRRRRCWRWRRRMVKKMRMRRREKRKVAGLHFRYCLPHHFFFIFVPWHLPQPFYWCFFLSSSFSTLLFSFFFFFQLHSFHRVVPRFGRQHNKPTVIFQY